MGLGPGEKLFKTAALKRIPLAVHLELTHRCNLNCIHCFHRDCRIPEKYELSSSRLEEIMDELKEMGTMFLIITGGEPFLRKDIRRLLLYASRVPFSLMIFTNGTLVNRETAEFISSLNAFAVHISLYSLNKKVHDKITLSGGSWEKAMRAVKLLKENGVNTVIKSPLMKENMNSIDGLRRWAGENKVKLKIDPLISPCYEKNCTQITSRRLGLKSMTDIFFESGLFEIDNFRPRKELQCGAGRNMAAVDPGGRVLPCVAWRRSGGGLDKKSFSFIWKETEPDYSRFNECPGCELFSFCGFCPGTAEAEGKEIFCRLAFNLKKRLEVCEQGHGKKS